MKFPKLKIPTFLLFIFLISSCSVKEKSQPEGALPRSTPEVEGISSAAILNFINAAESAENNEFHGLVILRHGKVISEGWWDPYKPALKHKLYSLSKSFTSTAIGFAVQEGLLSVEDQVISFFPDKVPEVVSENLASMKIKHLLSMSVGQVPIPGHPPQSITETDDWVRSFLAYPVENKPGTVFYYNSAGTFMLSAIITKVTGERMLDYLKPRLFDPLQITDLDWEVSPNWIDTGGWGLRLKTQDLAKFGQFYLQRGVWNGKRLLSEDWIEEATTVKIIQHPDLPKEERMKSDWEQGYCYKFWKSRYNSYRGDGAFGQLLVIMPEQDVVVAITAEVNNMQKELNLVWDYLLPAFKDEALPQDEENQARLDEKIATLKIDPPAGQINTAMEKEISGKLCTFESDKGEEQHRLKFENDLCYLEMTGIDGKNYTFEFAQGAWAIGETNRPEPNLRPQPEENMNVLLPFKVAGSYRWTSDSSLELNLNYIEGPHTEYFTYIFEGDSVILKKGESRSKSYENEILEGSMK